MKKVIILTLFIASFSTNAEFNDNIKGKITEVITYTDGDYIYFRMENPPSHPTCNNTYFVIEETVPYERRQMLLSRLLVAFTTQQEVNIGFDNAGNCVHSYVRVHRVG